jgi:threonine/homoserine/homoserine lactone efflux protein
LPCYGLSALAEQWSGVFTMIRIVGAIYLIYLGWKKWNSSSQYTVAPRPESSNESSQVLAKVF